MMATRFAQVFTDNHDNQRGHGVGAGCVVDHRDGQVHVLANIFALAYPYGYPSVMSSYYWQSNSTVNTGDSMGPPSTNDGGTTWDAGSAQRLVRSTARARSLATCRPTARLPTQDWQMGLRAPPHADRQHGAASAR